MSVRDTPQMKAVVEALAVAGRPLRPRQVAKASTVPELKVRSILRELERKGRVTSRLTGSPPAAVYTLKES